MALAVGAIGRSIKHVVNRALINIHNGVPGGINDRVIERFHTEIARPYVNLRTRDRVVQTRRGGGKGGGGQLCDGKTADSICGKVEIPPASTCVWKAVIMARRKRKSETIPAG